MIAGSVTLLGLLVQPATVPEDGPSAPSETADPGVGGDTAPPSEPVPIQTPRSVTQEPATAEVPPEPPLDSPEPPPAATEAPEVPQVDPPRVEHDEERAPRRSERRTPVRNDDDDGGLVLGDPVRRGVVLSGMLGYAGCGKPWCQGYRGGFGGGLELGVRFRRVMPAVSWGAGIGPYDRATLEEEVGLELDDGPQVKMHVVGVGASLFPLGKENRRIDPHFGARIGYGWVRLDFAGDGLTVEEEVKRGVITLGGGVDGFVTDNLIVGVRFDLHVMFGGEACINVSAGNGNSASACQDSDDLESRVDPRDWPLPFMFSLQLRRIWGF